MLRAISFRLDISRSHVRWLFFVRLSTPARSIFAGGMEGATFSQWSSSSIQSKQSLDRIATTENTMKIADLSSIYCRGFVKAPFQSLVNVIVYFCVPLIAVRRPRNLLGSSRLGLRRRRRWGPIGLMPTPCLNPETSHSHRIIHLFLRQLHPLRRL